MKLHLTLKVLITTSFLGVASTSLTAETMVLNADDGNGRILKITSPDDIHLDPESVVVAVDVFGDEDREVNGVLFQIDKTDDDTIGKVESGGVTVDLTSTHFIDGWAPAPEFTGGEGSSADNLAEIMSDIRWSQAPSPITIDVSGLSSGGLYELQILVNEGRATNDRRWDIGVNDVLTVDDFSSEGTKEGDDLFEPDNSFVYVGEFEANDDGALNVLMQQHIGGQDQLGTDNNPILQAIVVHAVSTSDDDPNFLVGSQARFGQVASTPATVKDINLRNTGPSNELVISAVEITGPDMANFTITNILPLTIPPDTGVDGDPEPKSTLQVSFDAAGRTGAFSATLTISSNDETEATHAIELSASVINRLGPAAHLPLDESADATELTDVSGNDSHGLVLAPTGTATLEDSPGIAGGTGLKVTGGGQLVIEGGAIPTLDSFSVSMWLQLDSLPATGTAFAKGNVDTPEFALLVVNGSLGWLPAGAGENPEFLAENVLTAGQAHHLVAVYDNTPGARSATLYVDGVEVATLSDPLTISDESALNFQFGSYNGGLAVDGQIDDVQVYARAISAEDVAQMSANPGLPLPIGDNGPVDSDGDGLDDGREGELGTDGLNPDSDDDGLNDFVEVETHGTDPLKADTDDDGSVDQLEILFGTDPLLPESKLGTFVVRNVSAAAGVQYMTIGEFQDGLQDSTMIGEEALASHQVINFRDNSDGNFLQGNVPFPLWDSFGARDDFGIYAFGKINITEAGPRTFGVNSDDGFELRINGEIVAEFPDPRGSEDTFGTVDLSEGEHDLELWFFERGGGAHVELFVNTEIGEVEFFEEGNFVLLPAIGEASGDVDNDTLSDFWENTNFGNLDETPDGDPDGDGLVNSAEEDAGTNPTEADSDGDSLSDSAELAGDPLTDPLNADTDSDGLDDGDEKIAGTNPTERDTDGDKFSDGFEVAEGSDPLDPDSPGFGDGGPIPTRVDSGKLTSADDLFIAGVFTHAVNAAETQEDVQVGDILFAAGAADNVEIAAVNQIELWTVANDFGEGDDNVNLARVASGIRWSPAPEGVIVTLKDVERGAHRLQLIFGEKCCDRGFAVKVNDEVILDAFSPNALQEGDLSGASGAYIIYEFNQSEAGDVVIDLNGSEAGFADGNAILGGVSLQFIRSIDGGGGPVTPPVTAREPVVAIVSGPSAVGLSLTGEAGKTYDIEYSTDLQIWETIETGLQGEINYEDPDAGRVGSSEGYYRAIEQ